MADQAEDGSTISLEVYYVVYYVVSLHFNFFATCCYLWFSDPGE